MLGLRLGLHENVSRISASEPAPTITVPDTQTMQWFGSLTFDTGAGNDISFTGSGTCSFVLTVQQGTLQLGSTTGLTNLTGNGTASITFDASIANANNAVQGMTYYPSDFVCGLKTLSLSIQDLFGHTVNESLDIEIDTVYTLELATSEGQSGQNFYFRDQGSNDLIGPFTIDSTPSATASSYQSILSGFYSGVTVSGAWDGLDQVITMIFPSALGTVTLDFESAVWNGMTHHFYPHLPEILTTDSSIQEGGIGSYGVLVAEYGPITSWSIFGGADAAKFTIVEGNVLKFVTPQNREQPTDTNFDNIYEVTIQATNDYGYVFKNLNMTCGNVSEADEGIYEFTNSDPDVGELRLDSTSHQIKIAKTDFDNVAHNYFETLIAGKILEIRTNEGGPWYFVVSSDIGDATNYITMDYLQSVISELWPEQAWAPEDGWTPGDKLYIKIHNNQVTDIDYDANFGAWKIDTQTLQYNDDHAAVRVAINTTFSLTNSDVVVVDHVNPPTGKHRCIFNIGITNNLASMLNSYTLYKDTACDAPQVSNTDGTTAAQQQVSVHHNNAFPNAVTIQVSGGAVTHSVEWDEYGNPFNINATGSWTHNIVSGTVFFTYNSTGNVYGPFSVISGTGVITTQSPGSDGTYEQITIRQTNNPAHEPIISGSMQLTDGSFTTASPITYDMSAGSIAGIMGGTFPTRSFSSAGTGTYADPYIFTDTMTIGNKPNISVASSNFTYAADPQFSGNTY